MKKIMLIASVCFALVLTACTPDPPKNQTDICAIFKEYPSWYWAAQRSQAKWEIPISVQMAIIHQESHFRGDAKPPRQTILWVIPWFRPTSANGYTQALDDTWKLYQKDTGSIGSRDNFSDAIDFVGWYCRRAHNRAGIETTNAYDLYLAYHDGIGGYTRGTYKSKEWLINVSKKVQAQANTYHYQLVKCRDSLPKKPWYNFWS